MNTTGTVFDISRVFELDLSGDATGVIKIVQDRCTEVINETNKTTIRDYRVKEIISISKL